MKSPGLKPIEGQPDFPFDSGFSLTEKTVSKTCPFFKEKKERMRSRFSEQVEAKNQRPAYCMERFLSQLSLHRVLHQDLSGNVPDFKGV